MLTADKIRHIHFIGVCGTGMASLAAMLQERGYQVTGSDESVYPPMSTFLAERKVSVAQGYSIAHLEPAPDMVVVGNALSRGNPEIEYVLNFRIPHTSFPEAVKDFFLRERKSVVVTGTHGKTTTTSMIAWVLHAAGFQPDFLIGGIAENFQSSFGLGGGKHFVIEGDEYDSAFFDKGPKFLHYLPDLAVVGNLEYDHADIYPDLESIKTQFRRFVNLIPQRGYLVVGAESPAAVEAGARAFCTRETFGLKGDCDWTARNIRQSGEGLQFDIFYRDKLFRSIRMSLLGSYNIRNALAATAVLNRLGVPEDDIRQGLEQFRGVRRRLQLRCNISGIRIYEDFAHHPTAIRETLQAIRASLQPARLWAIYEPRSATSRRSVFQHELVEALGEADFTIVPPLFKPEKVPEAERLDIGRVIDELNGMGRVAWNIEDVEGIIRQVCDCVRSGDVVVILSNGGFGGIYDRLPAALSLRNSHE
jgi:UDP-N-acetylmuramate: L-alanyl-gamma-D-glutamyl-meso-diaminopimelate ligase